MLIIRLVYLISLLSFTVVATPMSATQIMEKNFFASKLKKIEKFVTMTLTNYKNEKRVRKIRAIYALQKNGIDSKMLVRFIEPADIKGTGFLQHEHIESDDDLWIFLPALHKSKRLVSSNKKDSFIGSDFSYGDMLPPKVSLYQHKLLDDDVINAEDCYVIESIPINNLVKRNYGYGKKVSWVIKKNYHEIKVDYYDPNMRLLKSQNISEIKLVEPENNRWSALKREMFNHQTQHKTLVIAERYTTDIDIATNTFTVRTLEWF